ncbi:MAG: DHH family phosphoesterase [Bacillota bacterium]
MASLKDISDVLVRSSRILLCGHVVPDGDCVGSVLALGSVLEGMGKTVVMGSPDPIPETLRFLPGVDRFSSPYGEEAASLDFDTFVLLDCSVPERLGGFRKYLDRELVVVNIDHHVDIESFAHFSYVDRYAAATGEILVDLLGVMGVEISKDVAECLYVAIVTDTGSLQYENTTPGTLRKVAALMEKGIDASSVNIRLFEEKPIQTVQLVGAVISGMGLSPCGRLAWAVVDWEMLNRFSAGVEHTDGLINFLRTIKGVEVAILIREIESELYKVGFRSKGKADVHSVASKLGGGGHIRASGCVMKGRLDQVLGKVLEAAMREINEKESR